VLRADANMFFDREWVPDDDSVQASLDVVEEIELRFNTVRTQVAEVVQKMGKLQKEKSK